LNAAAEQIRTQLAQHGPLSFARFMEMALYCPLCGYYETKEDTTGKRGDFFTSVSVGSLFGELLAFQFATWADELGTRNSKPETVSLHLVEAGAHDAQLACDILNWLQTRRPELFGQTVYTILEPSARRREWQRETLKPFAPKIRWTEGFESLSAVDSSTTLQNPRFTIIFANELLDAFPVHRLGWDAQNRDWFEWGVALEDDKFVWVRLPASFGIDDLPSAVLEILPDGFTTEVCPAAAHWWRQAAEWLPTGKMITFDYGLEADEFFAPQRARGTLRAYHRHRLSDDLLANPGEQDLTAHVNFTAIRRAGETAGLRTETETTQSRFLTDIAQRAWRDDSGFGPWTPEHTRQFQTLTHPDHLGRAFRVLVQAR
jgi:SAM-dependent MidA family methyltransferase